MTPEEALQFVDQALAQMQGPRQFHINAQAALSALQDALNGAPELVAVED